LDQVDFRAIYALTHTTHNMVIIMRIKSYKLIILGISLFKIYKYMIHCTPTKESGVTSSLYKILSHPGAISTSSSRI
jgi:hypothetical protein